MTNSTSQHDSRVRPPDARCPGCGLVHDYRVMPGEGMEVVVCENCPPGTRYILAGDDGARRVVAGPSMAPRDPA